MNKNNGLQAIYELQICIRNAAIKAHDKNDMSSFDMLNLLLASVDERIAYLENS